MSIDASAIRFEAGASGGRYIYPFADGSEAELVYVERTPGIITITHTETPPPHRRQGVAAALVARAVDDFRAAKKKIVPLCPFAYQQFREHPEWAEVLYWQ